MVFVLIVASVSVSAQGQLVEEFNPPKANSCLALTAQSLADQLLDWNQLGRYYDENQKLKNLPFEPITSSPTEKGSSTVPYGEVLVTRPLLEVGEYCPLVRP